MTRQIVLVCFLAVYHMGVTNAQLNEFEAKGRILLLKDRTPIENARVQLFEIRGLTKEVRRIGETATDKSGRYAFQGLPPEKMFDFDFREYVAVISAPNCRETLSYSFNSNQEECVCCLAQESASIAGRIVDESGDPIQGALVRRNWGRPAVPLGLKTFKSKANGGFLVSGLPKIKNSERNDDDYWAPKVRLKVTHPDYPDTVFERSTLRLTTLVLRRGCHVTGILVQENSGVPVTGALVRFNPEHSNEELNVVGKTINTDVKGRFNIHLHPGEYDISFQADNNEWVAKTFKVECRARERVELGRIVATRGGWIRGKVIDAKTGMPRGVTTVHPRELKENPNQKPMPISIGVLGPDRTSRVQRAMAWAKPDGTFKFRVTAGKHYPYLLNEHGDRMLWETKKFPPIIVRAGGVSDCVLRINLPDKK